MLYAVLMVAIFSLLLQFYLHAQLSEARVASANYESTEAYLMAEWTADIAREEIAAKSRMTETPLLPSKMEGESKGGNVKPEEVPKGIKVEGNLRFSEGQSRYRSENNQLFVTVTTTAGHDFSYSFPLSSEK